MRYLVVPKEEAEDIRRPLVRSRMVRKDIQIEEEGGAVLLPLAEGFEPPRGLAVVEREPRFLEVRRHPQEMIARKLSLPASKEALLPQGWEMVGDVLTLRMPAELEEEKQRVAAAYAEVLGARAVLLERGIVQGAWRRPQVELAYGSGTETVHFEGDIRYKLDPGKVMFSSGNFEEKQSMRRLPCAGETVVDMFAGIGYFTLPLAKHAAPRIVWACELNPDSFHYLRENILLNGVEERVMAVLGDNRHLPGVRFADRILMGYLGGTAAFLPKAFAMIKQGGTIHFHERYGLDQLPEKMLSEIEEHSAGRSYQVLGWREVKSFGPATVHIVAEIKVLD
jgi:tRNA wybutosine-synthesizing protein 2